MRRPVAYRCTISVEKPTPRLPRVRVLGSREPLPLLPNDAILVLQSRFHHIDRYVTMHINFSPTTLLYSCTCDIFSSPSLLKCQSLFYYNNKRERERESTAEFPGKPTNLPFHHATRTIPIGYTAPVCDIILSRTGKVPVSPKTGPAKKQVHYFNLRRLWRSLVLRSEGGSAT